MAVSQQAGINYTRGNEKEADRVGIALLANSNFDPQGAPTFFAKMSEKYRYKSKPPAMLLTHPMPESRIADARQRAFSYPARPLPPSIGFELAKARIQSRYEGTPERNVALFKKIINNKTYAIKAAAEYGLAMSYFENKQFNEAKRLLEQLLAQDKNNLFYVDTLSDTYIRLNKLDKALKMLEELNLLMPYNQVVALNLASVLLEAKKYEKAEVLLQDYLLVKPGNFIAYDLLTTIYRKQSKMALMHVSKAEVFALLGAYPKAVDELQTGYTFASKQPLLQKRIKGRILQFQDQQDKLKRL
jgi:predicted Zn-dependent protease